MRLLIGKAQQGACLLRFLVHFSTHASEALLKSLLSLNDEFKLVLKIFDQHAGMALRFIDSVTQPTFYGSCRFRNDVSDLGQRFCVHTVLLKEGYSRRLGS
ncbi:exported hypothetical protein [Candidatus Nitrospira nitrificans]|uniref:Uncharacterized protein n=1 Tax=Candidatus Nitrospira nitrificans TaxID=1742973 RepID=A0A0S4LBY3_9BACT|nr:exported hypothetical protein [Candidatus Nitrospira nitrificans]